MPDTPLSASPNTGLDLGIELTLRAVDALSKDSERIGQLILEAERKKVRELCELVDDLAIALDRLWHHEPLADRYVVPELLQRAAISNAAQGWESRGTQA